MYSSTNTCAPLHYKSSCETKSMAHPLHLIRGLYRQLKTPILSPELIQRTSKTAATSTDTVQTGTQSSSRSNGTTKYFIEQCRLATVSSSTHSEKERTSKPMNTQFLQELYQLRTDIVSRGELYTIDAGADQQLTPHELSRRAAARAGLQLPEQYKH
jgi:hypothetical protein